MLPNNILSHVFFNTLFKIRNVLPKETNFYNEDTLEEALRDYLISTIAYKSNYLENMKEVEVAFENIVLNMAKFQTDLITSIKLYQEEYKKLLNDHPLVNILINAANNLGSAKFNIKNVTNDLEGINIAIRNKGCRLELIRIVRQNEETLPALVIPNVDHLEEVLADYIDQIKKSDTYYNIFAREGFQEKSETEKIKMIIEGTLLNISGPESQNLTQFFEKYRDFISDNSFDDIRRPILIDNMFGDELYVMAKRSELWYETPYYLAFMLKTK